MAVNAMEWFYIILFIVLHHLLNALVRQIVKVKFV